MPESWPLHSDQANTEIPSPESNPSAKQDRGLGTALSVWTLAAARRVSPDLANWMCKWFGVGRSLRAHIRIQFHTRVSAGPALRFQDGRYLPNEPACARAVGIETLRATYPWIDKADVLMYLEGFGAGEEYNMADWAERLRGMQDRLQNQPSNSPVRE